MELRSTAAVDHSPRRSAFSPRRSFLARSLIATAGFLVVAQVLAAIGVGPLVPAAFAAQSLSCRLVGDGGGNGGDDLYTVVDTTDFDPATNETSVGTGTGTSFVEANASSAFTGAFYGIDAGQLGIINTSTGVWSSAGLAPVGSGDGALGNQTFSDVDSLSFDPYTGLMWGAHRRDPGLDLLILIDPATGAAIPDTFGPGVDYVQIGTSGANQDIDDLAFDVETGRLYGIANSGANNADLVIIDMTDGSVTTVGAAGALDAEGLTVDQFGQLWITTGASPYRLYEVNKFTAVASLPRVINNGTDYESADCWSLFGTNNVSGTVFVDSDSSATHNAGDFPLAGATVKLYRDVNSDGLIDPGDWPLTARESAGDGTYSFTFAADGDFVLGVEPADLPSEWSYTTTDVHVASFVGVGSSDPGSDFGGNSGSMGDSVWDDANGDGIQDGGEPGIDGVTVDLWRDNNGDGIINVGDVLADTTATGGGGRYDFALLTADDYIVDVTDSGGVLAGTLPTGGTDPLPVSLNAGEDYDAADFGYHTPIPDIDIEKSTNGSDADIPTGPLVAVGGAITWDYTVTNPGELELSNVSVTDDNGTVPAGDDFNPTYLSGDTDLDSELDPGETWTYQASATATAGPYGNVATVAGDPPSGPPVNDTDPSHYFGSGAGVGVEKITNGADADTAPGPYVPVGAAITWNYTVTNTGNVEVTVSITDDNGTPDGGDDFTPSFLGGDTDGDSKLDTTETWTYQATGTAGAGPYGNVVSVIGTPAVGRPATDTDRSHYFGEDAGLVVEKATNGSDADTTPGPYVPVGGAVTWTYTVTNPGNVALSGVSVTDDQGVTASYVGGDANSNGLLEPTETWSYDALGTAAEGQYGNVAIVSATAPSGATPTDADPSHYFGGGADVAVEKATNGSDADTTPGPYFPVGGAVTWTYTVTNPGNVALNGVSVTDDNGTVPAADDFNPTYLWGDTDLDSELDPAETWTYQASTTAIAGPYGNVATVDATAPSGATPTDTDPSHYFGEDARVVVEKDTNGSDADTPTGPVVASGSAVTWLYTVTNPGNVALSGVSITDDNGTVPAADDFNPTYLSGDTDLDSELDPAETWTFQAIGTATVGQHGNVATVSATAPSGATPTDTDPSHYFGANGSIGDFVWNDLNGDGVQDPGEPGIAGITVTLVGAGSNGALGDGDDVVYAPQMVGVEGGYDFTQLPTGLYGAELDMTSVPAGFAATTPTRVNVTLALDEDYDDADFGVWEPASIGDIVWNDRDANGLFDGSESGLEGVTVELFASTDLSTLVATTVTGPTGAYSFIDLAPASYIVKFVRPAGFVISPQDAAGDTVDSDADPLTGLSHVVALAPGGDDLTVDVGMSVPLPAALGGVVWNDLNGDGSQDGGEPEIAGVTVHLYDTSNPSAPLVTTTTDGAGNYGFENLDAALSYLVGFLLPAGALGFTQDRAAAASSDSDADPATGLTDQVSLGAGAEDVTVDSGVLYPASLGDRVWYDVNGNALQDPNEPGVGGVVVQLLDATGAVIATTVTTLPSFASDPAAGTYSFENLTPGAYTVVVDPVSLPAGMTVSTFDADGGDDGEAGATLAGGDNRLDLDFGFVGIGVIGDTVWRDPNGNGVQDFREDGIFEAGIGGVTVTAIWAGPDRLLGTPDDYHHEAQTTDVKGNYLYSLLPLGGYQVEGGAVADRVLQVPELQVVTLEAADGAVAGAVLKVDLPYRVLATSESLPHTGTDTDRLAGLGLVLLLGGAFLILVTRKRRENA